MAPPSSSPSIGRGVILVALFLFLLSASSPWRSPSSSSSSSSWGVSGCQKEVVVNPDAECLDNSIEPKSKIRNGTYGENEYCNNCYCIKGVWKCEVKKCGCYPGAPIHIWMKNVRYACFCTLEGILNKTDCTPEWFSIRKGRSVPSRLEYQLQEP